MKNGISKATILLFLLAGLAGQLYFDFHYNEAFPEASIDLKLSREEVVAKSSSFLRENGFDLTGYRGVAIFGGRRNEIDFLERNLGLKTANELFRTTVPVWRWKIRWFKVLEEIEYEVEYTTDGRLAGFERQLPKSVAGARLNGEQARLIAENYLSRDLGIDMSRYRFLELSGMEDAPDRLDQTFVWKSSDFGDAGGSQYRLSVTVQGDKVGDFSQWLKIPETWVVSHRETNEKRNVFVTISFLPILILYLAMAAFFFWRVHEHDIRWRPTFLAAGIYGVIVLLVQFNKLPFALLSYDTAQSLTSFWLESLSSPFLKAMASFVFAVPILAATIAAGRLYLPDRPGISRAFTRTYLASAEFPGQVLLGYGLAFAFVGYVTLFYVFGQKFLGVWSPVEVSFGNEFSTYIPSFTAIHTGISAAFNEELAFRLFAIAVLFRLTKRLWPSVLIPALIWGFAHTSYPQEPVWIRGVELSIAGILYGWIFLRYGLITAIVSHYLYDVFVGIVPQLQSGRPGLIVSGLVALALPLAVVPVIRLWHRLVPSRRPPAELPSSETAAVPRQAAQGPPPVTSPVAPPAIPAWRFVCFALVAAAVYGASFLFPQWDFYGKEPSFRLTRGQGARLGEKALSGLGFQPGGFSSFTELRDHSYAPPDYVISRFGIRGAYERFRDYYGYSPQWVTRWYKEKVVERYAVAVDEQGRLTNVDVHLAEKEPGARLDESSAKAVAERFLASIDPEKKEDWEWIETHTMDRPNRTDYGLTYRDRKFSAAGLQRKTALTVAGDRISGFTGPFYDVPEEWTRQREVSKATLRNSVREYAGGLILFALLVFFVVQIIILLRRRYVGKEDVRRSLYWALAIGVAPSLLVVANSLPSFFHEYYYRTAASKSTYMVTEVLQLVAQFIGMPAVMFFFFLVAAMTVRAWLPERGDLGRLVGAVRPARWGSFDNRRGVVLGLAAAAFSAGLDTMEASLKALFSPDLFSPSAVSTDISVNQASELMSLAGKVPEFVLLCLGVLMVVAAFKRFCKREVLILVVLTVFLLLGTDTDSLSWRTLSMEWFLAMANFLILYYAVTRVVRWNLMAYLVWIWVGLNGAAVSNFGRFVLSPSPELFWPSIAQMAVLVVPVAVVAACGFFFRGPRSGQTPEAGGGGRARLDPFRVDPS